MNNCNKGRLIVIEGMDSSGKTTLIELVKQQLSKRKNLLIRRHFQEKIVFTSEPYGPSPWIKKYKQISEIIFSEHYDLEPETEALLFLAARKEHVSTFINPELEQGSLVFCDRFYLSSLVYQACLKKVNLQWLMDNIFFIVGATKPSITFLVEVDPQRHQLALIRKKIQKQFNKYDSNRFTFKDLQEGYSEAVKHLQHRGEKFVIIPPSLSLEEKARFIIEEIEKIIK